MKDEFCPKGHPITCVGSNSLYSPYHYCEKCDSIYVSKLEQVRTGDLSMFSDPQKRMNEMKEFAKFLAARQKVTKEDLKKLGYI